jgi:hypothetical protein
MELIGLEAGDGMPGVRAACQSERGMSEKEEGQPLSQDGWPFAAFTFHRACCHPEGGRMVSSVFALAKTRNLRVA